MSLRTIVKRDNGLPKSNVRGRSSVMGMPSSRFIGGPS
jgi:hypothetical protein